MNAEFLMMLLGLEDDIDTVHTQLDILRSSDEWEAVSEAPDCLRAEKEALNEAFDNLLSKVVAFSESVKREMNQ